MYKCFIQEVEVLINPTIFQGSWSERSWLNTPGLFYGAATDTCLAGPTSAPDNVLLTDDDQEFIYMQPQNGDEFVSVLWAAYRDPCSGYGANGDSKWTRREVQGWWKSRGDILAWIDRAEKSYVERYRDHVPDLSKLIASLRRFRKFITDDSMEYANIYMYFLDNGITPDLSDPASYRVL